MNDNGSGRSTVIECHQVKKTFVQGAYSVPVLNAVNLSVAKGERVAIVGASGAGKSTLLHLMGGLDQADAGEISVCGHALNEQNEQELACIRNQHLGFVYQFHHLLPEFSAVENVAIPLLIAGMNASDAKAKAISLLEKVGLGHRLSHKPGELSGGERQRTAIARAVVCSPNCVLADEPTGNLDAKNSQQIYELLLELNKEIGMSLVVVTHDLELAHRMDRCLEMTNGCLHTLG